MLHLFLIVLLLAASPASADTADRLQQLIAVPGVSGYEQQVLATGLTLILLLPAIMAQAAPSEWVRFVNYMASPDSATQLMVRCGSAMLIVQVVLLLIAMRRFVRARLLLEDG